MITIPSFRTIAPFYPENPPFSPGLRYPEYSFGSLSSQGNEVYDAVRSLLFQMGFDKEHFGTPEWNPFSHLIKPGDRVVIKPNWVHHMNPAEKDMLGMVTHTAVIRPVVDYVVKALGDSGEIIIGDAPIQSANFKLLMRKTGMDQTLDFLESKTRSAIRLKDFRREITVRKKGIVLSREFRNEGEFLEVNLKEKSFLYDIRQDYRKFRVTNYDKNKMLRYHNEKDSIYVIHKDVVDADAIIYLPKLKAHRKAGITNCLKNSIGINGQKDCLAHHRKGSLAEGGDAYREKDILKRLKENIAEVFDRSGNKNIQRILRFVNKIVHRLDLVYRKDPFFEGSWYGNDTLWRVILDLAIILFHLKPDGQIGDDVQRQILYVVDGIVAGEKDGPLRPSNKKLGVLAAGDNPLFLDVACARIIGFDYTKIPSLYQGLVHGLFGLDTERVIDEKLYMNSKLITLKALNPVSALVPACGWIDHIEL